MLRGVNVGGTGKLPMAELRARCEGLGFTDVRSYIASGNVVFGTNQTEAAVKRLLERSLEAYARKTIGVLVRTGPELAAVLRNNPFASAPPNRCVVIFLDAPPPADALAKLSGRRGEDAALGTREIYVFYNDGMADSKLKIPAAKEGTARNMNTVAKLAEMARAR